MYKHCFYVVNEADETEHRQIYTCIEHEQHKLSLIENAQKSIDDVRTHKQ